MGLGQHRLCLAHLRDGLTGVCAQQLLPPRDPLFRLRQQYLDTTDEGHHQGYHAPRLQAFNQVDLMRQRGYPHGNPVLPSHTFHDAADEGQSGQRRDSRQADDKRQCGSAQEGRPVSGY